MLTIATSDEKRCSRTNQPKDIDRGAYIERSNLTARLFSVRLTRKTLAFSKDVTLHRAAVIWEDAYYNLVRSHKSL
jgi:IS1 family transposase